MMFGTWGDPSHDNGIRVIHRALDAGINFVDTADIYSAGGSEEIVGKALAGRRDDVILASKFNNPMGEGLNWGGNSRRWIIRAVEASLRRLCTDWIDLYQVHQPDPETEIGETLDALSDLVRAGKVRYIGTSSFPAHQLVQTQWVAERRRLTRFMTEQPQYSLLVREAEKYIFPVCEQYSLGVLTWSPLALGWLSGKFVSGGSDAVTRRMERHPRRYDVSDPLNRRKLEVVERLATLASEAGVSLPHMALAFVVEHPAVTSAIIGPRTPAQLDGLLAAADLSLDEALLDRIDEIVLPGTNVEPAYSDPHSPALRQPGLRRRSFS
jgi:aryl-alcohol dehydrogenase-like predicted oxidoreductase